jgi:hypothetical protein
MRDWPFADKGGRMDCTVDVGTDEKHSVHTHFNQWFGIMRIGVDGENMAGDWRMFTIHRTRRYEFPVGKRERHEVTVEKTRRGVLGCLRDQTFAVLVDGERVGTFADGVSGTTSMRTA